MPTVMCSTPPQTVIVLLLRDFSVLSLSTALETMRIANQLNRETLFEWRLASEGGKPVRSSLGGDFPVDMGLIDLRGSEIVLVCGGADIRAASGRPVLEWLRRQARRGVAAGGLCTATYTLAKAGLLEGHKATIHWENQASFGEEFPDISLSATPYVIDGNRYSTAGGTSAIDLILKLIETRQGATLADKVAEQMIYSSIRLLQDGTRISLPHRTAIRHPKILTVIGIMEKNIENPVSPKLFASRIGVSSRQMERLFRKCTGLSPNKYYMQLRLAKARTLLLQTDMTVIDVGLACGFSSASYFARRYRAHFGEKPNRMRG